VCSIEKRKGWKPQKKNIFCAKTGGRPKARRSRDHELGDIKKRGKGKRGKYQYPACLQKGTEAVRELLLSQGSLDVTLCFNAGGGGNGSEKESIAVERGTGGC